MLRRVGDFISVCSGGAFWRCAVSGFPHIKATKGRVRCVSRVEATPGIEPGYTVLQTVA